MSTRSTLAFLVSIVFSSNILFAQVPPIGFATTEGGTGVDASWSIAVDAMGNTYTGGYFDGTITVGPSTLNSAGDFDFMVMKHDQNGNPIWAKNFGWVLQDMAFSITADANGNSYITARWFYQITVNGTTYYANNDSKDVCVIKLDTDGNFVWFSTFGGSGTDTPNDIAVDANGNVFVTGQFVTDFTFDGQTVTSNGSDDVFVVKLNSNGGPAWTSTFGSTVGDIGRGIDVDANGNCYITGNARGTSTIGTVTLSAPGNNYDFFVVKYNSTGVAQWAQSFGGNNDEYGYGLAADAAGNTYVAGNFRTSTMIGSISLTATGTLYTDGFIAKINSSGIAQWAHKIGNSESDVAYGAAVDASGNSYFIGQFSGNISIDGTGLFSAGNSDAFVTKLDATGNFDWAAKIGGTGIDYGYGVAVHSNGNCYATGFYTETMTVGSTILTSNGDFDAYIVKFGNAIVTGLKTVEYDFSRMEIGRFNLLGQPVQINDRGLQIVRYNDGTSSKVFSTEGW